MSRSLSARRAWIEIFRVHPIAAANSVALRKESVDRNAVNYRRIYGTVQSLSARRAWIEIFTTLAAN